MRGPIASEVPATTEHPPSAWSALRRPSCNVKSEMTQVCPGARPPTVCSSRLAHTEIFNMRGHTASEAPAISGNLRENSTRWDVSHGHLHRGTLKHNLLHRAPPCNALSSMVFSIVGISCMVFSIVGLAGMVFSIVGLFVKVLSIVGISGMWGSPAWFSPSWDSSA